jgi:hypothetical protein
MRKADAALAVQAIGLTLLDLGWAKPRDYPLFLDA